MLLEGTMDLIIIITIIRMVEVIQWYVRKRLHTCIFLWPMILKLRWFRYVIKNLHSSCATISSLSRP